MCSANSAEVERTMVKPRASNFSNMPGSLRARLMSLARRSINDCGVPLGARRPNHFDVVVEKADVAEGGDGRKVGEAGAADGEGMEAALLDELPGERRRGET